MGLSLQGVDAWKVNDKLQPGSYVGTPVDIERRQSNANNPQVVIEWRVSEGRYTGSQIRDRVTFTDKALGNVVSVLEAASIPTPQQEFADYGAMADWFAKAIDGKRVEFVVRYEDDYKGEVDELTGQIKQWPRIAGYRRPSDASSDVNNDTSGFAPQPQTADNKPLPF
jgi:hypothetical protein